MTENPLRCKYACARTLLRMPVSKRRRISREIKKKEGKIPTRKWDRSIVYIAQISVMPFYRSINNNSNDPFGHMHYNKQYI